MKDCAEVYKIGARAPGRYQLDTSGGKVNNDDEEVFCEDGWTSVMTRMGLYVVGSSHIQGGAKKAKKCCKMKH